MDACKIVFFNVHIKFRIVCYFFKSKVMMYLYNILFLYQLFRPCLCYKGFNWYLSTYLFSNCNVCFPRHSILVLG